MIAKLLIISFLFISTLTFTACGGGDTPAGTPDSPAAQQEETPNDDNAKEEDSKVSSVYSNDNNTLTVTDEYGIIHIYEKSGEFDIVVTSKLHGKLNFTLISFNTTTISDSRTSLFPQVRIDKPDDYIAAFAYRSLEDADRIENGIDPKGVIHFNIMDFIATTPTTGTFDIAGFYINHFDEFDYAGAQYEDIVAQIVTANMVGEDLHLTGSFVANIIDTSKDVTKVEVSFDMTAKNYDFF